MEIDTAAGINHGNADRTGGFDGAYARSTGHEAGGGDPTGSDCERRGRVQHLLHALGRWLAPRDARPIPRAPSPRVGTTPDAPTRTHAGTAVAGEGYSAGPGRFMLWPRRFFGDASSRPPDASSARIRRSAGGPGPSGPATSWNSPCGRKSAAVGGPLRAVSALLSGAMPAAPAGRGSRQRRRGGRPRTPRLAFALRLAGLTMVAGAAAGRVPVRERSKVGHRDQACHRAIGEGGDGQGRSGNRNVRVPDTAHRRTTAGLRFGSNLMKRRIQMTFELLSGLFHSSMGRFTQAPRFSRMLGALMLLAGPTISTNAHGAVLVSNLDQVSSATASLVEGSTSYERAQAFTTGSNISGYTIESVVLNLSTGSSEDYSSLTVSLHPYSSGNPGTKLYDFENPSSIINGRNTFTASANKTLSASTTYFIVVKNGGNQGHWSTVDFGSEDSGGAAGWSIANVSREKAGTGNWTDFFLALRIRVNGTVRAVPTASNGTVTTGQSTPYTFSASEFNFSDTDPGDTLASVKITTLESAGDLELDGVDVTLNQVIAKSDIDDGKLTFTPAPSGLGSPYATFRFKVNDGIADSTSAYTMSINVTSNRVVIAPARLTVGNGETATYTAKLSTQPAGNVTVSIAATPASAVTIAPTSLTLTFTTTNWSTAQSVSVTGC